MRNATRSMPREFYVRDALELELAPADELANAFEERLKRLLGLRHRNGKTMNPAGIRFVDDQIVRALRDCASIGELDRAVLIVQRWREACADVRV